MKLFLNNILKGLLVSLLVITLGGFLYLNISKPEEINLKLVSSSVVNQIGTKSPIKKESEEETQNNESKTLVEEKKEEEVINEEKEEDKKVEIKEETPKVEEKKEETPKNNQTQNNNQGSSNNDNQTSTPKGGYAPNLAVANTMPVLATYYGKITAYGPDCAGCGGMVAHGEYVGGGNIYYQDKTFGSVRIVAGDKSLGFGTIVRISGLNAFGGPILAIMLDTGGAIGFNKSIYFDLLYESERAASNFGSPKATFEILRYGF